MALTPDDLPFAPPPPEAVRRILVLRPGAIGDTLVTLPALLALRRHFPHAQIEAVGNAVALPIAEASGLIDSWLPFDDGRVTRLFMPAEPPPDDPFLGIDVAVAWGRDPDGTLGRSLTRWGASAVVVAPSRPDPSRPEHVARHLLRTLAPLGIGASGESGEASGGSGENVGISRDGVKIDGESVEASGEGIGTSGDGVESSAADILLPEFRVPAEADTRALAELAAAGLSDRPFVAIHPGSGSVTKNWPAEQYARLVDQLQGECGLATIVLGGPADAEALVVLHDQPGHPPTAEVVERPLLVVAALLRRAAAFLGNDSGLSHLAGLLGVPTLALFGPSDPTLWAPLGPRVRVVRSASLPTLPAETVLAELMALLDAPE